MRHLAALLLICRVNTWAQQPGAQPLSSPEPGGQGRQEFLTAYTLRTWTQSWDCTPKTPRWRVEDCAAVFAECRRDPSRELNR